VRGDRSHRLRGGAIALLASAAIHLLLVALLFTRPAAPPRGELVPFEVELRSVPGPAAPVVADSAKRRTSGPRPIAPAGAEPLPEPAQGPSAQRLFHGSGLEGLEALPSARPPDLSVRWQGAVSAADEAGAGDRGIDVVAAPATLNGWLQEQAGRDRVGLGLVHPYYRDVGRVLLGAWDAERAISRRGLSGYLAQAGENLRTFGRVWQQVADGYGRTGAPGLVDGGSDRVKELAALPPGSASDSLMSAEIQRQLRPAFSQGRVAVVRVTQAADGRLLSVELVSPSHDPEADRMAVAGVRAAAERLPAPPDEARAGRETLVSLWEFELEVSITPPIPVVAIEFDEVLGLTDVRVPLDRRIWKRVRLVAVL
jgi:TonB family protein